MMKWFHAPQISCPLDRSVLPSCVCNTWSVLRGQAGGDPTPEHPGVRPKGQWRTIQGFCVWLPVRQHQHRLELC